MPPKSDTAKSQRARFIAMAKEVGADDDEATFKAKLGKIAKSPPVENPRPSARKAKPTKGR